jgi:hypothetical protein
VPLAYRGLKKFWDFVARNKSFSLSFTETLELEEMRKALEGQFPCIEETWDNLLQCVQLYAIDIDNDAVFGELVGVMKSTKEVVDAALLASGQFTRSSPVCPDVAMVSGLDAGEGKDANDGEDILKEKDVNEDIDEDVEEAVLEEGTCKSGTGEDVSEDVGEDAEGVVLEEGIRRSGIGEDCEEGVNRDVGGNTDGKEIRSSQWIMFSSESPESLINLDNTVLATGEAVDSALVNSGQFVKENLVRISDAEVYDGTTPVTVLKDNHKVCKVRGVHCRSEGTETQGSPEEGIGNSELSFQTLAPLRSSQTHHGG